MCFIVCLLLSKYWITWSVFSFVYGFSSLFFSAHWLERKWIASKSHFEKKKSAVCNHYDIIYTHLTERQYTSEKKEREKYQQIQCTLSICLLNKKTNQMDVLSMSMLICQDVLLRSAIFYHFSFICCAVPPISIHFNSYNEYNIYK